MAAILALSASAQASCDPIDPAACLYPWPNDHFTVADHSTDTGLRLDLGLTEMPRNKYGKPIDPAPYNRNDGFSPGSLIVTKVPGLDTPAAFEKTGAVPIDDMGRSFDAGQPVVLINARTGKRQLIWLELDANPSDPKDVTLLIHPGKNLAEGERFVVALRDLKDAEGRTIQPQAPFRGLRDGVTHDVRYDRDIFPALKKAGIPRGSLYLAWDFTVASERNLSERMLHIRDDALASLAGRAPVFTVKSVTEFSEAQDPQVARRIEGTFEVPSYLNQPGGPQGSGFQYNADGDELPDHLPDNTQVAPFMCAIPRAAFTRPAHPAIYGHGLFSDRTEVVDDNVERMANEHDFVFCGTEWLGLEDGSQFGIVDVFSDFSRMPAFADRLQQAILNNVFLGRLFLHPKGFAAHPAFQQAGASLLDPARGLVYDGNS